MILERLGRFLVRRRRLVLVVSLVAFMAAVVFAAGIFDRLKFELFVDERSDAYAGRVILQEEFGRGAPNLLFVITAKSGSVDDPAAAAEAEALTRRLAGEPGVSDVASYWSLGRPPGLRSHDGDRALVVARIPGDDQETDRRVRQLRPRYHYESAVLDVRLGGSADFLREFLDLGIGDQKKGELITVPLILMALVVVFGSVVAALLPLLIALVTVLGTGVALRVLTEFTNVSVFVLFTVATLALGLSVDYSLFVVNRFREGLATGTESDVAVVNAVRTAGRTVLFSAAAVMVAFTALVLAPLQFLRSVGYAGMAAAAMAGLGSLILLPALLAALGPRVNAWTVWKRSTRPVAGHGFWHRTAVVVMRRPLLVAGGVIALLLVVASPILHFRPGLIDDRELPPRTESRQTGDILRSDFDTRAATPIFVLLPGVRADRQPDAIGALAAHVAVLPHVARVVTATGAYTRSNVAPVPPEVAATYLSADNTYLEVLTDAEPVSSDSERLIDRIRATPTPFRRLLVTGEAANAYDVKEAIVRAVPAGIAVIALATFLVLFIQFGSLLVPLKAIALNVLSLGALFGAIVWVFQDGHFSGLLDFTATNTTYINIPVFIFCLAFGLSMDYEVFLISRIKEEYDRTGDNEAAVALGLERSGRIVSAAAVLISLVFFTTGVLGTTRVGKMYGLGVAFVVLLDAFVIRGTLVPALMKLAGSANWWAPRPLRWLHDRIGLGEHVGELEPADGL